MCADAGRGRPCPPEGEGFRGPSLQQFERPVHRLLEPAVLQRLDEIAAGLHLEGQAVLVRGEAVPVSRLRERELTQALLRYLKETNF